MTGQKQVNINISRIGEVQVDAEGFTGKACTEATEQIEIALGGATGRKRSEKPEYHMPAGIHGQNKLTF